MSKRKLDKELDDLREEVSMLDTMLSSLVDVLEERGMVRHEDWEQKIKKRLSSR